jgi:hypothetical protein
VLEKGHLTFSAHVIMNLFLLWPVLGLEKAD